MPTYEYECAACEYAFEKYQTMTDAKLRKCPKCGKFKLQRLIGSGAGIIFKGSGFYETDYKTKTSTDVSSSAAETQTTPKTAETKTKVADKDT